MTIRKHARIEKLDAEKRFAFGRVYTSTIDGRPVIDSDGDLVTPEQLEAAAHRFVTNSRANKTMHNGSAVGRTVESFVATPEKAAALGMPEGSDVAWWIGVHVEDDTTWSLVKSGELGEFSFGGNGKRTPIERPADAHVSAHAPSWTHNLGELDLAEVSFVTAGAGERVAVALAKSRRNSMELIGKMKLDPRVIRDEAQRAAIVKALGGVEKMEVMTLTDVMAVLDEAQQQVIASALEAAQAGHMMAGGDAAPDDEPPAPAEPPAKDEDEDEDKGGEPEDEDKGDDMSKALKSRIEALEKQNEQLKRETREAAIKAARRDHEAENARALKGFPMKLEQLVAIDFELAGVEKSGGSAPIEIDAAVAAAVREGFRKAARALRDSELMGRHGTSRPAVDDASAQAERDRLAKARADKDSIPLAEAKHLVNKEHPDLVARIRAERAAR